LCGYAPNSVRQFADCPQFARVRWLILDRYSPTRHGLDVLRTLLASPHAESLRRLEWSAWEYRDPDGPVRVIAASPRLKNLEVLTFAYQNITEPAALELARSPHLATLRQLELRYAGYHYSPSVRAELAKRFPDQKW
jgi:hypothetical protein